MQRLTIAIISTILCSAALLHADDWPQWGGPKHDLVWRETGIVKALPTDGLLPRMWATPIGEGYAGPAVAGGKVYITDLVERANRRATERVLCLDAATGKELWKHAYPVEYGIAYPAGPRATPVIDSGRVYTIGAVGDMFCFEAGGGKVLWRKNFVADLGARLPTWGMAASPLVDGDQLITLVGGANGGLVVSFDKATGKELWRALDDDGVGYCPPVIFTFGESRQLIVWHPKAVSSLDPRDGRVNWEIPFPIRSGLCIPTPRQVGNRLFLTAFYNGPMMIDVSPDGKGAKVAWRGTSDSEIKTDGLHAIMCTPWVTESNIYGVCSYGQLRGLDAKTGRRLWETREATGEGRWWNAFLVPHEDRFFIHNEQGDLIIARLSPEGYTELSRAKLIEPTRKVAPRMTIWSHPAFAMRSVFARNDKEIVRVDLSASGEISSPRATEEQLKLLKVFREEFVTLSPGEKDFPADFRMGSESGGTSERPAHKVTLKHSFHVARYEVPQNLWEALMGKNPSKWKGKRNSVEMLSFDDAVEFCKKATELMRAAKLIEAGQEVRLPSEAEWEYAARAGTATKYSFGDDPKDLDAHAWHTGNAAGNDPQVGAKKPNAWKLYDVHGYLWEWCADAWHDTYEGAPADGSAWTEGGDPKRGVLRGGSWKDAAEQLTSSCRRAAARDLRDDGVGIRCVLAAPKAP